MKYKNFIAAFALLGILSSCDKEEDITADGTIKPVVSADATSFSVTEGDVITVTLTTNTPYKTKMDFKLQQVSGSANRQDYASSGTETVVDDGWGLIGDKIVLPAYATSTTFQISTKFDVFKEGSETAVFALLSAGNGVGLVDEGSQKITVTIANKTSNDFYTELDFSASAPNAHGNIEGGTFMDAAATPVSHAWCDIDLDLEVYDSGFNIVDDSYTSCPESIILPSTLPDDTYYIVPSFYSMNGISTPSAIKIPAILTSGKMGVFSETLDMSEVWNTKLTAPDYQIVRELEKVGNTWTLKDYNTGDIIASGRVRSLIDVIKARKAGGKK
ncbi:hypothetical protein EQG63_00580 [Flavobacterium amnicola]|uniref:Uncharacterized protein n=1 Tax=Flavobacterium amnicola TaxID=2506422 RepID=A0A4Q1K7C2_9FLAO|nr:hypothetical protein [Flavobacterium amnicola]RXR20459.1 hypothetical protein EQG63_00580 [Flavobacterium amnicola]